MSIQGFVEVTHIEVAQVVQSLIQPVKIIASKRGVARVLLQPHLNRNAVVRGTLQVTVIEPGKKDKTVEIKSDNSVRLLANNHPETEEQRRIINGTLNFPLKNELLVHGNLQLRLMKLQTLYQDAVEFKDEIHDYIVHRATPFPLRVLGIRYPDASGKIHVPRHNQFDESRFFLNRIFPISNTDNDRPYPVSSDDDSDLIIDAPEGFSVPLISTVRAAGGNEADAVWEKNINILHAYAMAIRGRNLDLNKKPQTHYYAMIDSSGVPFNGSASDVPSKPTPSTVAAGSAQPIGRNSDHYLLAHELGHTLGRLHPGACYNQVVEDDKYKYCYKNKAQEKELTAKNIGCQGYISNDIEQHIGVDLTPDGSIRRLLVHEKWHDLMTYCDRKWISPYTYEGVLKRIRGEETLKFSRGEYMKIIGVYDLRDESGRILYAIPTTFDETIGQKEVAGGYLVNLVLEDQAGNELQRLRVDGKRQEAKDLPDLTGVFQCTIERDERVTRLRVDVGSNESSSKYHVGWLSGDGARAMGSFHVNVSRTGTFANSSLIIEPETAPPGLQNPVYSVRIEEGPRWHTLYLGASLPTSIHLDPIVFETQEDYVVQITMSDGLEEIDLFNGVVPHAKPAVHRPRDQP